MNITVEISLYPLGEAIDQAINNFLDSLKRSKTVNIQVGAMSTIISGEYGAVMKLLHETIRPVLEEHSAAFVMKLSNACPV